MPIPTVQWAQRKDKLYITIDVQDVKDPSTNLENVNGVGKLTFSGKAGVDQLLYTLDLELMKEIDVSASKVSVTGRNIFCMISKIESGHWPRLTKESGKHMTHIKCDWNKWVDEDDEDEPGADKMDFSQYNFSGFGEGGEGGPGAEEEDEEDSDNEELPDLVK